MKIKKIIKLLYRQLWRPVGYFVFNLFYPHNLIRLKNFVARRLVKKLGDESIISPGFHVFHGYNFEASDGCSFGYDFKAFDFESIKIGRGLLASHGITLIAGTHTTDLSHTYMPGPIVIGKNVWLGANVVIVGPCELSENCIVGANSFVTGYFPPKSKIGGTPAKLLSSVK